MKKSKDIDWGITVVPWLILYCSWIWNVDNVNFYCVFKVWRYCTWKS